MEHLYTLPETKKIGHPKKKLVFQPSIFRGYVSFIVSGYPPANEQRPFCWKIAGYRKIDWDDVKASDLFDYWEGNSLTNG